MEPVSSPLPVAVTVGAPGLHVEGMTVGRRTEKRMEVPTMISMRTDRIMLVLLVVGLLTATAACALVTELRRPPAVRPAPTVAGPPASELVQKSAPPTPSAPATETRPAAAIRPTTPAAAAAPASAPPSAEPQEQPRATAPERQSNDADDPRAVIDWLLNRSSVRGQ
jgi:hypothetical protein